MPSTRPARRLIQQAYYVPEQKKFYKSAHVHDFVTINLGDKHISIDGGDQYERYVGDLELLTSGQLISFCLYSDMPFDVIAAGLLWGTYDDDDYKFKWVLLSECSLDHLRTIKLTQPHIRGKIVERVVDYWIDAKSAKC